MASCGEERHIILWEPFTLGRLTDLNGHNTSVTDLAINEERFHLISLGADKVVKIWDTRTYVCIQTIIDRFFYRPENILNSLHYDKMTHNIIVCSRKINFWSFKTQEEIKTSHEFEVTFCLYNTLFDAVVSGDEGGFINVWDIENGKLMSKFGDAHGQKNGLRTPITTGTFDATKRRLITAGADGTAKVWNFSNGQCLKDLKSEKDTYKVDDEITSLVTIYDPSKKSTLKTPYFLGVGWGLTPTNEDGASRSTQSKIQTDTGSIKQRRERGLPKLHIWPDPKGDSAEYLLCQDYPDDSIPHHKTDIMSCCFDVEKLLIFTGDHEGALIGWNFEGKFPKYFLHDWDKTEPFCKSGNLQDSKSIDSLVVLKERRILLSGSADQILRFWDLNDMQSSKPPLFKMHAGHDVGVRFHTPIADAEGDEEEEKTGENEGSSDRVGSRQSIQKKEKPFLKRYGIGNEGWALKNQLSALATDSQNNKIVTADT